MHLHLFVAIILLGILIITNLGCNIFAIVFIFRKRSETTVKDKIVTLLCALNAIQVIAYSIELRCAIDEDISSGHCMAEAFIICAFTYSSIGYFVVLAVERYISIVFPYQHEFWYSSTRNIIWFTLPPAVGVILGAAPLVGWSSYGKSRDRSFHCGYDFNDNRTSTKVYFLFVLLLFFGLPVVLTSVCFRRILIELRQTVTDRTIQCGGASYVARDSVRSVKDHSKSWLFIMLVYIGSWAPYAVYCFYMYFDGEGVPEGLDTFVSFLAKTSTISSPIVYCLIEKRFQKFITRVKSNQLLELSQTIPDISENTISN